MKNIKYVLLVFILFFTINVKAAETCDTKEYNRLKELAKKVEFDYDYYMDNSGEILFSIHAVNLNEDLKVLIINNYYTGDYREFKGEEEATLKEFVSGEKVVITIKGFVANPCSGKTVLTKTIRLPYFNVFYNRDKCKGNEDFKYCRELIDTNISQSQFEKEFELYLKAKEEKNKKEEVEIKEDNTKIYLMIGAGVLIIMVISLIVSSIVKRRKKNAL